jgi:membrane-associated protein
VPHHEHPIKHIWILTVVGVAIIGGLAIWTIRRWQGSGVVAAKPKA